MGGLDLFGRELEWAGLRQGRAGAGGFEPDGCSFLDEIALELGECEDVKDEPAGWGVVSVFL